MGPFLRRPKYFNACGCLMFAIIETLAIVCSFHNAIGADLDIKPEKMQIELKEKKYGYDYDFGFEKSEETSETDSDFEIHSKFIITSTRVDEDGGKELMGEYRKLNPRIKGGDCFRVDLYIPSEYDPILICLQRFEWSRSIFHTNFSIAERLPGGESKVTKLDELKGKVNAVKGFVTSFGIDHSFIQGQIINGSFYGTVLFSQPGRPELKMCSISPLSEIHKFLKTKRNNYNFDEDELDELISSRTRKPNSHSDAEKQSRDHYQHQNNKNTDKNNEPTSIVTCEGTYANQYFKESLQTILKRRKKRSSTLKAKGQHQQNHQERQQQRVVRSRSKRNGLPPPETETDGATAAGAGAGQSRGRILLSNPKNYKYLTVDFYVDPRVVRDQFDSDANQMIVALSSYVEMTDWITRAQDFSGDGIPDNFGFKFMKVVISEEYKAKEDGPEIYKGLRQFKLEKYYDHVIGSKQKKSHSVNIAIVPIHSPLFLHLAMNEKHDFLYDGCTACSSSDVLDGLINPRAERYEKSGEIIRMMYAIMHVLISSMVYIKTDKSCVDCTDMDQGVEEVGGESWGACLVEGMLFDSSNIPLNTFRLSKCSQDTGMKCIHELGSRKIDAQDGVAETCLKMETEDSYCGNGIVEGGEECDCGTLVTCGVQKCSCGPRNGVFPCMNLTSFESQLCQDLIKCRGYRFINEIGQMDGSHFLKSIPELLQTRVHPYQATSHGMSLVLGKIQFSHKIMTFFAAIIYIS